LCTGLINEKPPATKVTGGKWTGGGIHHEEDIHVTCHVVK